MQIAYYLKRAKAKQTAIYARLSYNGYQTKYYIPETINPKFWNKDTQRAKKTEDFKEYPEFNQRIDNISSDIRNVYRTFLNNTGGNPPHPDTLRELLDTEIKKKQPQDSHTKNFFGFFQHIIEQTQKGLRLNRDDKPISPNTLKTYNTTIKHLREFQTTRRKRIDFDTIDLDFYTDYKEYLMKGYRTNEKTGNKEPLNLATNTIGKHIQIIKMVMNEATERGLNKNLAFKTKSFKTVREKSESVYLQETEINELALVDLSSNQRLETVRDLFLVGCYTGLRYSDYSILQPENIKDGFIETTQIKTGEPVIIPIHHTVKAIIEKYNGKLPRSISNQKTNQYLKEICSKVLNLTKPETISFTKGGLKVTQTLKKWELITTHTARRSFASNEYLAGTPTLTIMAITGHKTEKAFLRYIKLTPNEHAKLLKLHWEERNKLRAV